MNAWIRTSTLKFRRLNRMFLHKLHTKSTTCCKEDESSYKQFKSAAIVSNTGICSTIGKNVLEEGGSVIDAAIATKLALGVVSFQRAGIGGGFFMVFYDSKTKTDCFIDAREKAPHNSKIDMFRNDKYNGKYGRTSVAVPGELRGYWEAHRKFGKLPWYHLFQPAIELAENGFKMTRNSCDWAKRMMQRLPEHQQLRDFLTNTDGTPKKMGDHIVRPKFADTLRSIACEGPEAFYNGSLTESILEDLKEGIGGPAIINRRDLSDCWSVCIGIKKTVKFKIDDLTIITSGTPSGGPVLAYVLNILKGYKFSANDWQNNKIMTLHRIAEALKFAYHKRNRLGDPDFNNEVNEIVEEMLCEEHCESIRKEIDDAATYPPEYYIKYVANTYSDYGTAHVGVLGQDESAVSMTSSINKPFSSVIGRRTGIIFNNTMTEFSRPTEQNLQYSNNLIESGKRPLSSMSPTVVLKETQNGPEVKMVVGGTGGMYIISATAQAIMQRLWFNKNIDEAVKTKRIHYDCSKNILFAQEQMDGEIVRGLENRGHRVKMMKKGLSCVQIVEKIEQNKIVAKCDERRGGYPDGY